MQSAKAEIGRKVIRKLMGSHALAVWDAILSASKEISSKKKTSEVRNDVLALAAKIVKIRKGLQGSISSKQLNSLGERAVHILRELLFLCRRKEEDDQDVELSVTSLCEEMRRLHDDLLGILRPLFAESILKPKNGLRLTNSFIHFGSEYFLGPLINGRQHLLKLARDDILNHGSLFLRERGLAVDEAKRTKSVIVQGQRFARAENARSAMQTKLTTRSFSPFMRDVRGREAFKTYIARMVREELLLFSCWLAIQDYKSITRTAVRKSRASTLLTKFLSPQRVSAQSIRGVFDSPISTATVAHTWKSVRQQEHPHASAFEPVEELVEKHLECTFEDFLKSSEYTDWRCSIETELENIHGNLGPTNRAEPKTCDNLQMKDFAKYVDEDNVNETPRGGRAEAKVSGSTRHK